MVRRPLPAFRARGADNPAIAEGYGYRFSAVAVDAMRAEEEVWIYADGASRGNPGPACFAFVLVQGGAILFEGHGYAGVTTNNVAEYRAIIHGLMEAARQGGARIVVCSDSELVIRQITGEYRIRKDHLADLCAQVHSLSRRFEQVRFQHAPRTERYIQRADALCNRCLDEHRERRRSGVSTA
ncbi:MAG: ribonuclease HI family protein [Methanomicrobiales archaeon]|nr:ribonuclease HI family protein [Methanomicrobiales archaeon]MDI6875185.1 ribonuclease HI family protein [Methanomicrobiales archaeon]